MKLRMVLLLFWMIIVPLELLIQFWFGICWLFNTDRATAIVLGYDRLGNVAMGQGNETISSWAGKRNSWLEPIINKLFEWLGEGKNHCDRNLEVLPGR